MLKPNLRSDRRVGPIELADIPAVPRRQTKWTRWPLAQLAFLLVVGLWVGVASLPSANRLGTALDGDPSRRVIWNSTALPDWSGPTAVTLSSFTANPVYENAAVRVALNWVTGIEINTAGFNLYRSDHTEGPYARINMQLIPSSAEQLAGSQYQYLDTTVVPGKTYFYQLEDVELNGTSVRHGPTRATVTAPPPFGDALPLLGLIAMGALAVLGAGWLFRRRWAS